jgi:DNA-binding NarL/FixJ family response regulator
MMNDELSKREQDVLSCLIGGRSNKEIGSLLGISPGTVQKHVQRIFHRLRVQSRTKVIMAVHLSTQTKPINAQCEPKELSKMLPVPYDA